MATNAADHAARQLHRPLTAADIEAAWNAGFEACRGRSVAIATDVAVECLTAMADWNGHSAASKVAEYLAHLVPTS